MQLTVVGCGDAFGSGGRLQTCFNVAIGNPLAAGGRFLIDCGATALIGHQRAGLDPNAVDTILISHLHGDHFSGLVWWMLHALHVSHRTAPLVVAGPPGLELRYRAASEALFPGAMPRHLPFETTFVEINAGRRHDVGGLGVTAFEVMHPSGAPSHALRIEAGGKVLAFSGDTEWVETLVPCGAGADLFICECYGFERPTRYHLTWRVLSARLSDIGARKAMISHMSMDMLAEVETARRAGVICAEDGLVIEV